MKELVWNCCQRTLTFARPLVQGIVNVTPDSFSDGGQHDHAEHAIHFAQALVADGADILDIGAESTRPGSEPIPLETEIARGLPVVSAVCKNSSALVSIDTTKSEMARQCLRAGAVIINDVSGLRFDPAMIDLAAQTGAGVIVMHMQGTPATMQHNPTYADVVGEVRTFFEERLTTLQARGIGINQIALDPGIGFGKSLEHNLQLLAALPVLAALGRPICLGVSRKGFLGSITGRPVAERMPGSLAVACFAIAQGAAHILRVHDVRPTADAVKLWSAQLQYIRPSSRP